MATRKVRSNLLAEYGSQQSAMIQTIEEMVESLLVLATVFSQVWWAVDCYSSMSSCLCNFIGLSPKLASPGFGYVILGAILGLPAHLDSASSLTIMSILSHTTLLQLPRKHVACSSSNQFNDSLVDKDRGATVLCCGNDFDCS